MDRGRSPAWVPARVDRWLSHAQKLTNQNKKAPCRTLGRPGKGEGGAPTSAAPIPGNKSLEMVTTFLQNSLDKWFQKGYNLVASKQQSFFMCSSPPFDPRLSLRRGFPFAPKALLSRFCPGQGGFAIVPGFCSVRGIIPHFTGKSGPDWAPFPTFNATYAHIAPPRHPTSHQGTQRPTSPHRRPQRPKAFAQTC